MSRSSGQIPAQNPFNFCSEGAWVGGIGLESERGLVDPNVDYLVDGSADSLIAALAPRSPGSFVVYRSSAFTYKGRE
jgi:hypothetical protein